MTEDEINADLERISAEAKALPTLKPSRDLWAGIEARIGGAAESTPRPMPSAWRRWSSHPAVRLATAASLLVAATAGITWKLANAGPDDARPLVANANESPIPNTAAQSDQETIPLLQASVVEVGFESMSNEIDALELVVTKRRATLDPKTIQVVEKNLALIDKAIAESRAALAADPASGFLAAQLARSYSSKLTLLRETAKMPAGT